MKPTELTVTGTTGPVGESIENHILERVSGSVEKHMGQVVNDVLEGANIPVACFVLLERNANIRRMYVTTAAHAMSLFGGQLGSEEESDRHSAPGHLLRALIGDEDSDTVSDRITSMPFDTGKLKEFRINGLVPEANLPGLPGHSLLWDMFAPKIARYTAGNVVAAGEDAIRYRDRAGLIYLNQRFPEIHIVSAQGAASRFVADPFEAIGEPSDKLIQVDAIFRRETGPGSNPNFYFESKGSL